MAQFNHEKALLNRIRPQYRRIGQMIQSIISSHVDSRGQINDPIQLEKDLERYSGSIEAWANTFWLKQDEGVAKKIAKDFKRHGFIVDLQSPAVRASIASLHQAQVDRIVTLPREAAKKAQAMAFKAATATGDRAESLIMQMQGLKAGYPEYAARRLARTEIAKCQSALVQTQAKDLGVTHYRWRTVGDEAVRSAHAELDGKIFAWDDPPDVPGEGRHHPGESWNCRCYAEPLLPEESK